MITQNPFIGAARGRWGGLIFQHYDRKNHIRSMPVMFHYRPTPQQIINSQRFLSLNYYTSALYEILAPYFSPTQTHGWLCKNRVMKILDYYIDPYEKGNTQMQIDKMGFEPEPSVRIISDEHQIIMSDTRIRYKVGVRLTPYLTSKSPAKFLAILVNYSTKQIEFAEKSYNEIDNLITFTYQEGWTRNDSYRALACFMYEYYVSPVYLLYQGF